MVDYLDRGTGYESRENEAVSNVERCPDIDGMIIGTKLVEILPGPRSSCELTGAGSERDVSISLTDPVRRIRSHTFSVFILAACRIS